MHCWRREGFRSHTSVHLCGVVGCCRLVCDVTRLAAAAAAAATQQRPLSCFVIGPVNRPTPRLTVCHVSPYVSLCISLSLSLTLCVCMCSISTDCFDQLAFFLRRRSPRTETHRQRQRERERRRRHLAKYERTLVVAAAVAARSQRHTDTDHCGHKSLIAHRHRQLHINNLSQPYRRCTGTRCYSIRLDHCNATQSSRGLDNHARSSRYEWSKMAVKKLTIAYIL